MGSYQCELLTLVNVVIPVGFEPRWVEKDAGVWAEGSQVVAVLGLDYQGAPSATVLGALFFETLTDLIQAVGFHPRDVRGFTGLVLQSQSDGEGGDKVDIADVDEQLPAVVGELAKGKVSVGVRVSWVEDRRFHESRSWVHEELQTLADGEPDAAASDARHSGCDGVPRDAERNGDVFSQVLTCCGWRRRVVRRFGIRREAEELIVVVQSLAGWFGSAETPYKLG